MMFNIFKLNFNNYSPCTRKLDEIFMRRKRWMAVREKIFLYHNIENNPIEKFVFVVVVVYFRIFPVLNQSRFHVLSYLIQFLVFSLILIHSKSSSWQFNLPINSCELTCGYCSRSLSIKSINSLSFSCTQNRISY